MKFSVTFKSPDAVDYALLDEFEYASPDEEGNLPIVRGRLNNDHTEVYKCLSLAQKFVSYGEYIVITFDTEAGTATVDKV